MARSERDTPRHLLRLPVEVLQMICAWMIVVPRNDHLNFLLTCRYISYESYSSFLARPLRFTSQSRLINFASTRQQHVLSKITDLTVCLEDISKDAIRPFLAQAVLSLSKTSQLRPYEDELARITTSLARFRNLTSLSILRSQSRTHNSAPRFLAAELLRWITHNFPNLLNLRFDYDAYDLTHLSNLPRIATLQISGSSFTSPVEALTTLSFLTHLTTLQLLSSGYTQRRPYFASSTTQLSITPPVLQNLNSLVTLIIAEPPDSPPHCPALLTPATLKALASTHAHSLSSLTLTSLHPLPATTAKVLSAVLLTLTNLRRLRLEVPDLPLLVLDALPGMVSEVAVLVSGEAEAERMLGRLGAMEWRLGSLRKVVFLVARSCGEQGGEEVVGEGGDRAEEGGGSDVGGRDGRGLVEDFAEDWKGTLVGRLTADVPWMVRWEIWRPFDGGFE